MRSAIPSTMAVLPTPGSPISTGLFLVRRDRTCIARRISSSRPMTGSSLPLRASSVRSRVYLASDWYFPSASGSVTRCVPRTSASAFMSASLRTPASFRARLAAPWSLASSASRRCSLETYSSLNSFDWRAGVLDQVARAAARRRCRRSSRAPAAARRARSATAWRTCAGSTPSLRSSAPADAVLLVEQRQRAGAPASTPDARGSRPAHARPGPPPGP